MCRSVRGCRTGGPRFESLDRLDARRRGTRSNPNFQLIQSSILCYLSSYTSSEARGPRHDHYTTITTVHPPSLPPNTGGPDTLRSRWARGPRRRLRRRLTHHDWRRVRSEVWTARREGVHVEPSTWREGKQKRHRTHQQRESSSPCRSRGDQPVLEGWGHRRSARARGLGAHPDVALGSFGTMITHHAPNARGLAGEENSCSSRYGNARRQGYVAGAHAQYMRALRRPSQGGAHALNG